MRSSHLTLSTFGFVLMAAGCTAILGDLDSDTAIPSADGGSDSSQSQPDGASGGGDTGTSECEAGVKDCVGNTPRACVGGTWQNATPCTDDKPVCLGGDCSIPPSCSNLLAQCPGGKNCCNAPVA